MQTLRQIWPEVVGEAVAAQTYPVNLRRQVLQVATSTPAWAQNLTFQRQRILKKLNSRLHPPSWISALALPLGMRGRAWLTLLPPMRNWWTGSTPSPVSSTPKRPTTPRRSSLSPSSEEAKAAFERWAQLVKRQQTQQNLFPCPACGCPTPAAELERWLVCGFCHRQSLRGSSRRYPRELPPAGIASTPAG